jgi:alkylhydroperoxidase family enzyme
MDIRHAVGVRSGTPAEALADLPRYGESPRFTERERAALEFSERITRNDLEVSDECLARLREHFSEAEVVELTFIVGYQTFASKFAKAFRLAPQGFSSAAAAGAPGAFVGRPRVA